MKNKLIKAIVVLLSLCFILLTFFACDEQIEDNKGGGELSAPTLAVNGDVAVWGITDDADEYKIYVDGNYYNATIGTRFALTSLETGTHAICVSVVVDGKESPKSNVITYTKAKETTVVTMKNEYHPLSDAEYEYSGIWNEVTNAVLTRQLKNRQLYADFVNQFRRHYRADGTSYYVDTNLDSTEGGGWRGEFWGKMVVGAVDTYRQTKDEELYDILMETARDLLTTQDDNGRISSYNYLTEDPNGSEFWGWDMWNRKYVLMGMESIYDISRDEQLKAQLVDSMLRQLDYILEYVGPDKIFSILDVGSKYGGLNSSSILEAIVKLYVITGEQRVLDFATHIVTSGGSKITNLIDRSIENKTLPYTWGTPKAYEMTSFFDGVLDYYLVTGITKYKTAAINYAYAILNSEVVTTGGAGYNSEEFNHSVIDQANPTNEKASLETCVTVTLLRFGYKVYMVTGDPYIIDVLETTIYNALIGAVDFDSYYEHVFTSYFNLCFHEKFKSAAGGMSMEERSYGCCIAWGSEGTGCMHKMQYVLGNDNNIAINFFFAGEVKTKTPDGKAVTFKTETNYPYANTVKITVSDTKPSTYTLNLRIPNWSRATTVAVNGRTYSGVKAGEYYKLMREWKSGDEIIITFDMNARLYYGSEECRDENAKYNVAVQYGPIVLARDIRLDGDIYQTVNFNVNEQGNVDLKPSSTATFRTICEFEVELKDGKVIHLVDYASAGKTFDERSFMTVFMPTTDYWEKTVDLSNWFVLKNSTSAVVMFENNQLVVKGFYQDFNAKELEDCAFKLIDRGNGKYSLHYHNADDTKCATYDTAKNRFFLKDYVGNDNQLFTMKRCGLFAYKIVAFNGALFCLNGEGDAVHLYSDCNVAVQKWEFIALE